MLEIPKQGCCLAFDFGKARIGVAQGESSLHMKFSVLMSVYRREQPAFLHECLQSLHAQTQPAHEIVVVLDGEITQDLQAALDEWRTRLPLKIVPLPQNVGLGKALNAGIEHCTHDYIFRMDSDDIAHGPIECVFTRDEETGLTGAFGMKAGFMSGKYLINLDSEDEGQIFVSCAGGINTTATFTFTREAVPAGYTFMEASLKGLTGGHSGDDINKKRANAIKIMARFLYLLQSQMPLRLAQWNSGRMHNAIPRDGKIIFAVPADQKAEVEQVWKKLIAGVEEEFHVTDPVMHWNLAETQAQTVLPATVSQNLIRSLQALDNGPLTFCQDKALENMVETSSNVASVQSEENKVVIVASQRSNVMSNLKNMANTVKAAFELGGADVLQNDGYPAWKMNPNSKLVKVTVDSYKKLFGKTPVVRGIHAGLECGLFSEKYPELDMVSFGPTLRYVHTPDERLLIPTVQMVWDHLLDVLKNIPQD